MKTAASHFRKIKDTFNLIGAKTGIAVQYSQVNFLEEANKERKEAIELCKLTNNYISLVNLYFNTATDFRFVGNTQGRVDNIKQAIETNSKANRPLEIEHLLYTNLVVALLENDELHEAETYYEKVVSYKELNEAPQSRESFIEAKKWLLYKQGNYDEAITLGKEYLELKQKRHQYAETLFGYKFLKLVLEAKGDKLNAYDYSEGYAKLKDSMESAKNVRSLAFYQTLYETEKNSHRIEAQQKDIELLNEKSKVKSQYMIFGFLGVVTLFGLVLLVRSRNRAKENQLIQEQFSKDLLQSQETERTRIAKDLHDSVGQQLTLIKRKAQDENKMALANLTNNTLEEVRSI
ncbi:histidine kinase [Winogradskyella sp.]|uniref:sensor histidine kinase n=1 Tax=Winogradskyella sp. TaxID=1883156 RepID=UPI0025E75B92|nr:histidine kinase [Winogradskyella sp.]